MNRLSEFDVKQIRLIKKKISLFENNNLDSFYFVCDLGGLLNALDIIIFFDTYFTTK